MWGSLLRGSEPSEIRRAGGGGPAEMGGGAHWERWIIYTNTLWIMGARLLGV